MFMLLFYFTHLALAFTTAHDPASLQAWCSERQIHPTYTLTHSLAQSRIPLTLAFAFTNAHDPALGTSPQDLFKRTVRGTK